MRVLRSYDTMERVMHPYFIVTFFTGCGIYIYPKSHSRLCLSVIYLLTVWIVYAWVFYVVIETFISPGGLSKFLNFFSIGINLFLSILSIFITFFEHEKYQKCIRKLDLVDDTLVELGISKEYDKERTMIKWSLISWFITVCLINICDGLVCLTQYTNTKAAIIIPWIIDYSVHINTLHDLTIIYMLRYIGSRLDKINDCIVKLSENEDCGLRCMWKKPLTVSRRYIRNTEYRKHVLWTAIHLHLELCWIARNINVLYGMQMTVQMASYFVFFLGILYFQYRVLLCLIHIYESWKAKLMLVLSTDMWTTFFLIKFVTLNHMCESVSAKAEKTKTVIHKLTNFIYFADMHDMIYQFSLQILLHPLKFSGMGLFYFGYKFIRSFIVWIFTIFLLIMQEDTYSINMQHISSRTNVSSCFL